MAFLGSDVIGSNQIYIFPNASLFHFGVLQSTMHNAWIRYTCGRLESRYRYSAGIVYNNFPWPQPPSISPLTGGGQNSDSGQRSDSSPDKGRPGGVKVSAIETAAQAVLDARALYPESSLADLYDPLTMPPELVKAHAALDKAVDAAYGYKGGKDDAARVAFLFERYRQLTSLLPAAPTKKARKRSA